MDYNQYYSPDNDGQAPGKTSPFSIASMICGIVSITLCCLAVLSPPLGALGILFAILTKRKDKPMPTLSLTGLILSCIGIFLGLCMGLYMIYMIASDPELREMYEDSYEYYYDELYEYNFEHL